MKWKIRYAQSVQKSLKKLPPRVRQQIRKYLETRLLQQNHPRQLGKALKGENLWRYRVGDFRVICELRDYELVVLVVRIGDRKSIYR